MQKVFEHYTTNEIEAKGWLKRQLEIQANGLSGNLDKMWPDVRDSKWIGGDKEGWERVPYWLDGFIPLAYLLKNDDMIARAKKYVDAILAGQNEDGWICPCSKEERANYDLWALFLILKVLVVYYECSGDERIEQAVYKALKQFYVFNCWPGLKQWGHARWYECVISINWLYARRPEKWLVELAQALEAEGMNHVLAKNALKKPAKIWSSYTHVVNLAMSLKTDAVMSVIDGRNPEKYAKKLLKVLQRYHGNVNGYFNGDECLAGNSPTHGTELCGVAEAMYSYEILSEVSGKTEWMDLCERLAFNAFPATVSEDMWTHQYDQLTNQPYCVSYAPGKHFTTNGPEAHIFGLEPNFGCCTANFNQAFPKFALSTYMKAKDGVAVVSLAPSALSTTINGVKVRFETVTEYPFNNKIVVKVNAEQPVKASLYLRVPAFVDSATVNGANAVIGEYYRINKTWTNDTVEIVLSYAPRFVKRGTMFAVESGALVYSVPMKERWEMREYVKDGVERKFPYCDYYVYPESEWQYGFASDKLTYGENGISDHAFNSENPPCYVTAQLQKIDWGFDSKAKYIARKVPLSRVGEGEKVTVKLVPYGCAKLRMTELPFVE